MQPVTRGDHSRLPLPTSTRQPGGFLLITALLIITGLTALLTASLTQTLGNVLAANQSAASQQALENAEAGIDHALQVLIGDFRDSGWDTVNPITENTPNSFTSTSAGPLPVPAPTPSTTNPGGNYFRVTVTPIAPIPLPTIAGTGNPRIVDGTILQLQAQGFAQGLQNSRQVTIVTTWNNPWPHMFYGDGTLPPLTNGQKRHELQNVTIQALGGIPPATIADASEQLDPSANLAAPNPPHLFELTNTTVDGAVQLTGPLLPDANILVQSQPSPVTISPTPLDLFNDLPDTPVPPAGYGPGCTGNPSTWPDLVFTDVTLTDVDPSSGTGSGVVSICVKNVHLNNATLEFSVPVAMYVAGDIVVENNSRLLSMNQEPGVANPLAAGGGGGAEANPNNFMVLTLTGPTPTGTSRVIDFKDNTEASLLLWAKGDTFNISADPTAPGPYHAYWTGSAVVGRMRAGMSVGGTLVSAVTMRKVFVNTGFFTPSVEAWCDGTDCPSGPVVPPPPPPPPPAFD